MRWLTLGPILSRYVIREILIHLTGVLAVVLCIFVVRRFGGLLADAAEGSLPADVIFHLLGLRTLMALPSLLPVVLYLAVLLGLGRLYQDNEMTALQACGVTPVQIPRTVLLFSLLVATVIGALSLSARPWAAERFRQVKQEATRVLHVGGLSPGRFYEMGRGGEQVIFVQERAPDGSMKDVFVQDRHEGEVSILFSERAYEQLDEESGYRFLKLVDGYRYDLRPDKGRYEITQYGEFVIRMPLKPSGLEADSGRWGGSTLALMRSGAAADIAELQWRLAMPVSALLLALLALPLSRVDPRRGKYIKLFIAILLYLVYRQLLGTARDWVARETLAPFPGIWGVHALCLAAGVVLIAREPVGRWWRRSTSISSNAGRQTDAAGEREARRAQAGET